MIDDLRRERFTGFSDVYDSYRPSAPIFNLKEILSAYGKTNGASVVDVGCGTGLSALIWSPYASRIVGIDPNPDMLATARTRAAERRIRNVDFLLGESTLLPVGDVSADLITCSQSFHWMDPAATLPEFARVLKSGGLLAVYDYDLPPVAGEIRERAYSAVVSAAVELLRRNESDAVQWPKGGHLRNITESGLFRFSREVCFSVRVDMDNERFIGLLESQGSVQQAIKTQDGDFLDFLEVKRREIRELPGSRFLSHFAYRLRLAVR